MAKYVSGIVFICIGSGLLLLVRSTTWKKIEPSMMVTQRKWDRMVGRNESRGTAFRVFIVFFGFLWIGLGLFALASTL